MNIDEQKFPILSCMQSNLLNDNIIDFVKRQVHDEKAVKEIMSSAAIFKDRNLTVTYITQPLHQLFLDTSNFISLKSHLKNTPTGAGLLLLPETLFPDFRNVPDFAEADCDDYPIDAILFSWLNMNDHDKLSGSYDPEMAWENDADRQLYILPIYQDGTTQATGHFEMSNNDEIYGWEYSTSEGRGWYGKIHDYVMSFILSINLSNNDQIHSNQLEKLPKIATQTFLNTSNNLIEILEDCKKA